ncbi:hypothetical protein RCC89_10895 [Cytophagaceae bacterium ABcell3]|nr:hypothetical protein RCC89_10895 [Cytophagaceae bacterium ABcell3]
MNKKYFLITLVNLLIAGSLGVLLRYMSIAPTGLNFRYIVHAHSHVAFLGWAYMAFFLLILYLFLPEKFSSDKSYKWMFWLNQISVVGMLVAFPLQGYALYSIAFSTLHIFLSYWFAFKLNKDLKTSPVKSKTAINFIKGALLFLVISSIGPFGLGIIMAKGLADSPIYDLAIYYYLHFQYNGWFIFSALGILFKLFEQHAITFPERKSNLFFKTYFYSNFPAFLLSALWLETSAAVNVTAFVSALVQLLGTFWLVHMVQKFWKPMLAKLNNNETLLLKIALASFILKNALQFLSSFVIIFQIRHFIIGYLHLTLIGCISLFLISVASNLKFNTLKGYWANAAVWLIASGYILSEIMLFAQGTSFWLQSGIIPFYDQSIIISSLLMPVGFLIICIAGVFKLFYSKPCQPTPNFQHEIDYVNK